MGRVRNDIDDGLDDEGLPAPRVLPHLDYAGVRRGGEFDVPDDEVYHWVAGGFTALTRYPVPYRLYPNHAHDPLAYALPEPDPKDPSAVAVGQSQDALPPNPAATATVDAQPAQAAQSETQPAATAPTAASQTAPAASAVADAVKE